MNVARMLYPIKVLGPGNRLGIWVVGCHRKCVGCSNPELWEPKPWYEIKIEDLMRLLIPILQKEEFSGIIITGGEPFNQSKELVQLLKELKKYTDDILVYTGYLLEELREKDASVQDCLSNIGVLIDGPYIEELNNGVRMRGSANQTIHYLNNELKNKYEEYICNGENMVQNFMTSDGTVSVGIHKKDFADLLIKKSKEKGVIINE